MQIPNPQPAPKCSHCAGKTKVHENLCPSHLLALQKVWDERLANAGFEDIEQREDGNLKSWASSHFASPSSHNPTAFQAKEEYYRLAGQFLYDYTFASPLERAIWKYHSEGVSVYKIPQLLKKKGVKVPKRSRIHQIIQKLANEMTTKLK